MKATTHSRRISPRCNNRKSLDPDRPFAGSRSTKIGRDWMILPVTLSTPFREVYRAPEKMNTRKGVWKKKEVLD
jgi:hypothetical protein